MSDPDQEHIAPPEVVSREKRKLYAQASNGLANLQLAHKIPVNHHAMEVVVNALWEHLPAHVRGSIFMSPPNGPDLWGDDEAAAEAALRDIEDIARKRNCSKDLAHWLMSISVLPSVIWPLWVEDEFGSHWVVLYWTSESEDLKCKGGDGEEQRKKKEEGEVGEKDWVNRITDIRLFDPALDYGWNTSNGQRNWERRARITRRFARMLRLFRSVYARPGVGALRWSPRRTKPTASAPTITLTTPHRANNEGLGLIGGLYANFDLPPGDTAATGECCYVVVKQLLAAVLGEVLSVDVPLVANDGPFFVGADDPFVVGHARHLGQLAHADPYLARMEMAGICAWSCMQAQDFQTRIGLQALKAEKTPVTVNGAKYYLDPRDLARPEKEYAAVTWGSTLQAWIAYQEVLVAGRQQQQQDQYQEQEQQEQDQGRPDTEEGTDVEKHKKKCRELNPEASETELAQLEQSGPLGTAAGTTRKRAKSASGGQGRKGQAAKKPRREEDPHQDAMMQVEEGSPFTERDFTERDQEQIPEELSPEQQEIEAQTLEGPDPVGFLDPDAMEVEEGSPFTEI